MPRRLWPATSRFWSAARASFPSCGSWPFPARRFDLAIRQDRFEPIVHSLNTLRFNHAEYFDVIDQNLQAELIREGPLLVRVVTVPGAEPAEPPGPNPGPKLQLVTLELKPEHRLLIAPGDDVIPGQVIARRDLNPEERARLAALKARIEGLERDKAAARRERLLLESELTALHDRQSTETAVRTGLSQNPLLEKELRTLETRVAETAAKIAAAREKLEKSALRITDLHTRIESETENLRLIEQSLSERTQIRAAFSGRIERIEKRPKGEGVSVGVMIR